MRLRKIMKTAWAIARKAAKKFGGRAFDYFAQSLKLAWAGYKKTLARVGGDILGLEDWFMKKENLDEKMIKYSPLFIKRETKKAYLLECVAGKDFKMTFWAPKSVCF